jgi:hypothetical protein
MNMFDWFTPNARAAAAFDAKTLTRIFGRRALVQAHGFAARAHFDGHRGRLRHWRLVAKEIARGR